MRNASDSTARTPDTISRNRCKKIPPRGAKVGTDASKGICDAKEASGLRRAERQGVLMGGHARICQAATAAFARSIRTRGGTYEPGRPAGDAAPEGDPASGVRGQRAAT